MPSVQARGDNSDSSSPSSVPQDAAGPLLVNTALTFVLEPHAAFCSCPTKAVLLSPASGSVLAHWALRGVKGLGCGLGEEKTARS